MDYRERLEEDVTELDNDTRSAVYYLIKFLKDLLIFMWDVVTGIFRRNK